jgi:hypothetical protein
VHIGELVCDVTVTLGSQALPLAEPPPEAVAGVAGQPPSRREPALPRTISPPEAEEIMASTVARQTQALAAEGGVPPGVDPKALADRVYRLMREELELARERE